MNNSTVIPLDNISYNEYNCLARKSSNPYKQCCYKKKLGDLCKVHHNSKYCIRIDEHIDKKRKFIRSKKTSNKRKMIKIEDYYTDKNKLEENNQCVLDTIEIDNNTIRRTHKFYKLHKNNKNIKDDKNIIDNNVVNEKINIQNNEIKIQIQDISNEEKEKEKEKNMKLEIIKFFDSFSYYFVEKKKLDKVILLQRNFKKYLNNKKLKLHGEALINRELCVNAEDFFTFQEIKKIQNDYFISFRDDMDKIFGFDVRSFKKLVEKKMSNPYNRKIIPEEAKCRMKLIIKELKLKRKKNNYNNEKVSKEQKIKNEVVKVFQKIDETESYAGGTNINWFLDLDIVKLKKFYKLLEDIWNYRAELSNFKKNLIVPNKIMFPVSVMGFHNINDKNRCRKILLEEMWKMVSCAIERENRVLGCYYVLIGLVEISPSCAEALPWLIQ